MPRRTVAGACNSRGGQHDSHRGDNHRLRAVTEQSRSCSPTHYLRLSKDGPVYGIGWFYFGVSSELESQ